MASSAPSLFRHRDFRLYQLTRLCAVLAVQIESVAIGWQVYELTGSALALGYTGLAQFLSFLSFSLLGGHVADRVDRRGILVVCQLVMLLCSLLLLSFTLGPIQDVRFVYGVLVLFGTARAFYAPAGSALTPHLVPPEELTRAIAINSTTWQVATITGPAVGGVLYGWAGAAGAYLGSALLCALTVVWMLSAHRALGPGVAAQRSSSGRGAGGRLPRPASHGRPGRVEDARLGGHLRWGDARLRGESLAAPVAGGPGGGGGRRHGERGGAAYLGVGGHAG